MRYQIRSVANSSDWKVVDARNLKPGRTAEYTPICVCTNAANAQMIAQALNIVTTMLSLKTQIDDTLQGD